MCFVIVFVLKSTLSDVNYCYSSLFFLILIFMEYLFHYFTYSLVCVIRSEVNLRAGAILEGCQCQPGLPTGWRRVGAALEGLAGLSRLFLRGTQGVQC